MPRTASKRRAGLRWIAAATAALLLATAWCVEVPDLSGGLLASESDRFQVLDRHGTPLAVSYQSRYNQSDMLPLHAMPQWLQQAFVTAEDRHFFAHHGIDWPARLSALYQNIRARKVLRGASTISEQVVRILHPRPRNMWSRWVEGCEALLLESRYAKGDILAFYMNQVPYAANRRGVVQAARYYFNRDLDTLNHKEMLALAVLPRAPSALDLYHDPAVIEPAIARLLQAMEVPDDVQSSTLAQPLATEPPDAPLPASHFIRYIRETTPYILSQQGQLRTTLDGPLQRIAQRLLNERVKSLSGRSVHNAALLVADHTSGEILAWVVAGNDDTPGAQIDMVRTPRQPGSSLKPFLYAQALDLGWTAATPLNDAPLSEAIGSGLHAFNNYSHQFYGQISLREALGNSLNIPALETIGFVTPARYLGTLHRIGFASLAQPVEYYKEGLALGNGEVSLLEMVQAYNTLAHRGLFVPLTPLAQAHHLREPVRVFTPEAASLVANILSDPSARRREFGAASVLNLPVQTAVKTGTSSDYRDAWVLGFNARFTVGVWMGNVNREPMNGVTGSIGPALVMRSVFSELMSRDLPRSLYISPRLERREVCSAQAGGAECYPRTEYFIAGTTQDTTASVPERMGVTLIRPTEGLHMAYDPRLPAEAQAFEFKTGGVGQGHSVQWRLNDALLATTGKGNRAHHLHTHTLLWPVARGRYTLQVSELDESGVQVASDKVHFWVK